MGHSVHVPDDQLYKWLFRHSVALQDSLDLSVLDSFPSPIPPLRLICNTDDGMYSGASGSIGPLLPDRPYDDGEPLSTDFIALLRNAGWKLPQNCTAYHFFLSQDACWVIPAELTSAQIADIQDWLNHQLKERGSMQLENLQFRSLLSLLPDAILIEDKYRKISFVNQAFCDLFSIPAPPQALLGYDCVDAIRQAKLLFDNPRKFEERVDELIDAGKASLGEVLYMRNGNILSRDFQPITDEGRFAGQLWVYRNITTDLEKEYNLQFTYKQYQELLDNLNVGILEVDAEGIVVNAYDKFCQLVGYSREELMGKDPVQLLMGSQEQEGAERVNNETARRADGVSSAYEIPLIRKDGTKMWFLISGTPIYNQAGEYMGSIGLHMDITDRKLKEQELQAAKVQAETANIVKEQFMANLSHEMLTPINGILGFTNLMIESDSLSEKQQQFLENIQTAGNNLLVLIEDLLDFSQLEDASLKLSNRVFELPKMVRNACDTFQPQLKENRNSLHITIDPALPKKVKGDPSRIAQIIKHLTSNAIKFTRHGRVDVRITGRGQKDDTLYVVLEIQDTGVGIPRDEHNKIFNRFYKLERFDDKVTSGTGIGLSIVQRIVNQLGGSIELESEVGKGTIIRVYLTLSMADEVKVGRMLEQFGSRLQRLRVLVAEDNPINQMLVRENMKQWHIPYEIVDNGMDLIEAHLENPADVVLMDVLMPRMDGLTATRHIRNELAEPFNKVPIIALTAYAMNEDEERCRAAGMNDYIAKPFSPAQLLQKIIHYTLREQVRAGRIQQDIEEIPAPGAAKFDKDYLSNVDLTNLEEFVRGNEKLKRALIQTMVDQAPQYKQEFREYLEHEQWDDLFKTVHKLKPNVTLMGFTNITGLLHELNEDLRVQRNLGTVPERMTQLMSGLDKAVDELKAYLSLAQ